MLLLMGAALLVAQLLNLAFILNEQQKLSLAQSEGPAIVRFAQTAAAANAGAEAGPAFGSHVHRMPPAAAYGFAPGSVVDRRGLKRSGELETRLAEALREARVPFREVRAATAFRAGPPGAPGHHGHARRKMVVLSARLADGRWLNGRLPAPGPDPWLIHQVLVATVALFAIVFGAVFWISRRLARPLRELTGAAERFEGRMPSDPVRPSGPADIRQAIEAFNAMNRRTVALLDEKDRMLGAIGHDLRTPLASIRIRAEAMEPEEEREKLVASVEEMAATLEDILTLARTGRAREPVRAVDVGALVEALVEGLGELGMAVAMAEPPRAVLEVQPGLLRRAVRNLVENGVTHGGGAEVLVEDRSDAVEIRVEDRGPGIPPDRVADVLEPFRRLEGSRNRESGGAGLGLAIAHSVALAHGGRLVLEAREGGGLSARLIVPRLAAQGSAPAAGARG
jgi:signal transduction histidine kinase